MNAYNMQLSLQVTHLGAARASAVLHRTALPHPALLKTTPVALQPRKHVLHTIPHAGSAAAGLPADDHNSSSSSSSGEAPGAAGSSSEQKPKRGFWGSVKYFFVGECLRLAK